MKKLRTVLVFLGLAGLCAGLTAGESQGPTPKPVGGATVEGGLARSAGLPGTTRETKEDFGAQTARYFQYRWHDLLDIIDFSVGAGPGFLVNVHATKACQAIGGYSDSWRVGMRGRSYGIWRETRKEVGISLLYYQKVNRDVIRGTIENQRSDEMDLDTVDTFGGDKDRSFLGLGGTVHLGVLVDANIRPAQLADFILGWFTVDILEDDNLKAVRNKDL
jgi:hypothetical protein